MRPSFSLRSVLYFFLKNLSKNIVIEPPFDSSNVRRVLILRYDRLGDMVVTLPMIDLLREILPNAQIDVLASAKNAELIKDDSRISTIYTWDRTLRSAFKLRKILHPHSYDLVYCAVLAKLTTSGFLINIMLGKTPCKISNSNASTTKRNEYHTWYNMLTHIDANSQTMVQTMAEMVTESLGIPMTVTAPDHLSTKLHSVFKVNRFGLHSTKDKYEVRDEYSLNHTAHILFYNISAGEHYRQWSLPKHRSVLTYITMHYPSLQILINAMPSEQETANILSQELANVYITNPHKDLQTLVNTLNACDIVVTPDTSITHFATALSKPTFLLCTPISSSIQWLPFGVPYVAVYSDANKPIESIPNHTVFQQFDTFYNSLSLD